MECCVRGCLYKASISLQPRPSSSFISWPTITPWTSPVFALGWTWGSRCRRGGGRSSWSFLPLSFGRSLILFFLPVLCGSFSYPPLSSTTALLPPPSPPIRSGRDVKHHEDFNACLVLALASPACQRVFRSLHPHQQQSLILQFLRNSHSFYT